MKVEEKNLPYISLEHAAALAALDSGREASGAIKNDTLGHHREGAATDGDFGFIATGAVEGHIGAIGRDVATVNDLPCLDAH